MVIDRRFDFCVLVAVFSLGDKRGVFFMNMVSYLC